MKYLIQMMIIGGITFLGEMLHVLIPLPVPASVYGMASCLSVFACILSGRSRSRRRLSGFWPSCR